MRPGPTAADRFWADAWAELRPRLDSLGISRVGSTTHLDRVGVPTATAVRPWTSDVIWVYSGKGLTRDEAFAKAVLEAAERSCSLWPDEPSSLLHAAPAELGHRLHMDPRASTMLLHAGVTVEHRSFWVEGRVLGSDAPVLVPAELAFGGNPPAWATESLLYRAGSSNGLGAAFDVGTAVRHALREVMERDVLGSCELAASHADMTRIAGVLSRLGIDPTATLENFRDRTDVAQDLDIHSLPRVARDLVDRFAAAGVAVRLKVLPHDFGLTCVVAAAQEGVGYDSVLAASGSALHEDPGAAVVGALLELAQTRATDLQGAREDRHEPEKMRKPRYLDAHWLLAGSASTIRFDDLVETGPCSLDDLAGFARQGGLRDVFVVEFPAPARLSVVRTVVPEAQMWHTTAGRARAARRPSLVAGGSPS